MVFSVAVFGLVIGSFLNVVIARLRSGERGWRSRSECPLCHAVLRPSELVPVVSFLMLKGKCRSCRQPISWQYPLVELSTMALFLAAFFVRDGAAGMPGGEWLRFVRDLTFISALTVIFVVDLLDMVVFDSVTLPMIAIAAAFNLALGMKPLGLLWAVLAGGGFFLFQYLVSKGRWIGGGDIRIGAMIGAMLGFPGVIAALFIAYIVGAVVAVVMLALKKTTWSSQLAFGTFLSLATVAVLLFGDRLWSWYGNLLGF